MRHTPPPPSSGIYGLLEDFDAQAQCTIGIEAADKEAIRTVLEDLGPTSDIKTVFNAILSTLFEQGRGVDQSVRALVQDLGQGKEGYLWQSISAAIQKAANSACNRYKEDGHLTTVPAEAENFLLRRIASLNPKHSLSGVVKQACNFTPGGKDPKADSSKTPAERVSRDTFVAFVQSEKVFKSIVGRLQDLLRAMGPRVFNRLITERPIDYLTGQVIRRNCFEFERERGVMGFDGHAVTLLMEDAVGTMTFNDFCDRLNLIVNRMPLNSVGQTAQEIAAIINGDDPPAERVEFDVRCFVRFETWIELETRFKSYDKQRSKIINGSKKITSPVSPPNESKETNSSDITVEFEKLPHAKVELIIRSSDGARLGGLIFMKEHLAFSGVFEHILSKVANGTPLAKSLRVQGYPIDRESLRANVIKQALKQYRVQLNG